MITVTEVVDTDAALPTPGDTLDIALGAASMGVAMRLCEVRRDFTDLMSRTTYWRHVIEREFPQVFDEDDVPAPATIVHLTAEDVASARTGVDAADYVVPVQPPPLPID
jgi:hypothetical protein